MNNNNILVLYVGYYLARFNKVAYRHLNFGNQKQTHERIGRILSINPNTVQNRRDDFDPFFEHRAGWHQIPLSTQKAQILNALSDMTEPEVRLIVEKIIKSNNPGEDNELLSLAELVDKYSSDEKKPFILRGPTGKKAEQIFIEYFNEYKKPKKGKLFDTRDLGCGYDFEIRSKKVTYFIEVKGLSDMEGGILLTDKEWRTAKEKGDNFYIALVSNIENEPKVSFIKKPYLNLNPKENIIKTIQINWSVSTQKINELINK